MHCTAGLDDNLRGNNRLMMDVAKITRLKPQHKFEKARAIVDKVFQSPLNQFGVEMGEPIKVPGREVPEDKLEVGRWAAS